MKLLILVLLFFTPLFVYRYDASQPNFSPGDKIRITTLLSQQPLTKGNNQLINIYKVNIFLPRFPEYHYGDLIQIEGTVEETEYGLNLENPIAKKIKEQGTLANFRSRIIEIINETLPQDEAALVAGVALGAKENLTKEFKDSLVNTGLLHIVVASGMNVTIVARTLISLLTFFLTRPKALITAIVGIWVYTTLVGLGPPIIRAAIMGTLAFTAQETGRIYWAWWGLFVSAIIMLLIWPSWITDVGFLLSFAATAGILAFEKAINSLLSRVGVKQMMGGAKTGGAGGGGPAAVIKNTLKQDFSTSLAAQIGTTPILLFSFGQFTPWSPFINAMLLWTIAPIMSFGFLGGAIGVLFAPIGKAVILLTYPLAFLFTKVVSFF